MKILSASGLFIGALLSGLLTAGPAAAAAGYCEEVCNVNEWCHASCYYCGENSGNYYQDGSCAYPESRTCGDMGYQCRQWTCTPNWVATSSTPVGGFAVNSYFPDRCDYYGLSMLTMHDQNNCGQADYQTCQITFHTSRYDHSCCTYWWCGGNTCGWQ